MKCRWTHTKQRWRLWKVIESWLQWKVRWEGGSKLFTVVYGEGLAAGGCSKSLTVVYSEGSVVAGGSKSLTVVYDEGLVAGGWGKSFMGGIEILEAMGGISLLLLEGDGEERLGGVSGREDGGMGKVGKKH